MPRTRSEFPAFTTDIARSFNYFQRIENEFAGSPDMFEAGEHMPSQTQLEAELIIDSAPDLKFYRVRDDCVRAYQPANEEEMFLVTQIARAWYRLQRYYDLETELMEKPGLAELFEKDLERFNALNRSISTAERMWRHAVQEFQAARRRRAETGSLASPRRRAISTVGSYRPVTPVVLPLDGAPHHRAKPEPPHRE